MGHRQNKQTQIFSRSAESYDGFVQNFVTVIQIHEGLCMLNYEQCDSGLHSLEPNV